MIDAQREKKDYQGSPSTLCKGCGHDSITSCLVGALYELQLNPQNIIKLSGIGCSSKTPNYFLDQSFGFNSIHGRMAPLATGVHLSQPKTQLIGISGDGDTASIGLGGFLHLVRRNVPIVYIIADNGVYGLTKGQFSATSLEGDHTKLRETQVLPELDMAYQALVAGCDFVARSFSGDNKQLKSILKLALLHKGTAVIDVVSPCVAYGNREDFSKSYTHTQEINSPLNQIDIINEGEEIKKEELKYEIKDLSDAGHDYKSFADALKILTEEKQEHRLLHTGLIYFNPQRKALNEQMSLSSKNKFEIKDQKLSPESLSSFNKAYQI